MQQDRHCLARDLKPWEGQILIQGGKNLIQQQPGHLPFADGDALPMSGGKACLGCTPDTSFCFPLTHTQIRVWWELEPRAEHLSFASFQPSAIKGRGAKEDANAVGKKLVRTGVDSPA